MIQMDQKQINRQIKEIERLKPDWNSYGALPVNPDVIRHVREFLALMNPTEDPYIGPKVNGGVTVEWHDKGYELEFEFDPPNDDGWVVIEGLSITEGVE
jgi:hypothetical protein